MNLSKFDLSDYPEPSLDPRLDEKIKKVQETIRRFDSCQLPWHEEKKVLNDELTNLLRQRYPLIYVVKIRSFYQNNIKIEGFNYCYCSSLLEAKKCIRNYRGPHLLEIKYTKSINLPAIILFNLNRPVNLSTD